MRIATSSICDTSPGIPYGGLAPPWASGAGERAPGSCSLLRFELDSRYRDDPTPAEAQKLQGANRAVDRRPGSIQLPGPVEGRGLILELSDGDVGLVVWLGLGARHFFVKAS